HNSSHRLFSLLDHSATRLLGRSTRATLRTTRTTLRAARTIWTTRTTRATRTAGATLALAVLALVLALIFPLVLALAHLGSRTVHPSIAQRGPLLVTEQHPRVDDHLVVFAQSGLDLGHLVVAQPDDDFTRLGAFRAHDVDPPLVAHVHAAQDRLNRDGQA